MLARKRVQRQRWNQSALQVFSPAHVESPYRHLLECVDRACLGVVVLHGGADTSLALSLLETEDDPSADRKPKSQGHTGRSQGPEYLPTVQEPCNPVCREQIGSKLQWRWWTLPRQNQPA